MLWYCVVAFAFWADRAFYGDRFFFFFFSLLELVLDELPVLILFIGS